MAGVVIGSFLALMLGIGVVLVVRSRERNRAGLCAHCGGSLGPNRTFTVDREILCRSCAENAVDRYSLAAWVFGAIMAMSILIGGGFSVSLLLDGRAAGWLRIVVVAYWLSGILTLVLVALSASLRPSRLSLVCASVWMLAFTILQLVWLKGGESSMSVGHLCRTGAAFPMVLVAILWQKKALRLSKELEAP